MMQQGAGVWGLESKMDRSQTEQLQLDGLN